MLKTARIFYVLASVAFIFIGTLHCFTHFMVLSGDSLETQLVSLGSIDIFGAPSAIWDLWQATSIMMGAFSVALGAVNLAALSALDTAAWPPVSICLINIAMLCVIATMGFLFLGPIQAVGAPIGIVLFGVPLFWRKPT